MLSPSNPIYPFVFETSRAYKSRLRESGLTVDAFNATPLPDELSEALKVLQKSAATASRADFASSLTRGYSAAARALAESVDIARQESKYSRHIRRNGWLQTVRNALIVIPQSEITLVALKAYQREENRDIIIGKNFPAPEDLIFDNLQQDVYLAGVNLSLVYAAENMDSDTTQQIAKAVGKQLLEAELKRVSEAPSLDMGTFLEEI